MSKMHGGTASQQRDGAVLRSQPTLVWAYAAVFFALLMTAFSAEAATLGPSLSKQLNGLSASADVGTVIVAFDTTTGLGPAHFAVLTAAGVTKGITLTTVSRFSTTRHEF